MISNLNWETLEQRRMRVRVTMFYKITNNVVAIDLNQYGTHQQKITRFTNKLQFQTYSTTKDYFKYSFFPQTTRIWNSLPASIIVPGQSLDQFKTPRLQILNTPFFLYSVYTCYICVVMVRQLFSPTVRWSDSLMVRQIDSPTLS